MPDQRLTERPMEGGANPWDDYAPEYGEFVAGREQADLECDPILAGLLDLLGDIAGRDVLDAACGEGFLARRLAARGARVVGLDLSPRLIAMARAKDPAGAIDYRVADLSRPLPEFAGRLFEPYATTKTSGTGLGLAIAQRIAYEHNGELSYVGPSANGRGAVFRLVLPVEGPSTATELPPSSDG